MVIPYNFAPAAPGETLVFGSERPAARTHTVSDGMVADWIEFMRAQGVQRVINLLDERQMGYFESDLMQAYARAFGEGQAIWVPVVNFTLIDAGRLRAAIFPFLREAEALGEKTVVHCAGGIGRTGHVLAAWLVHRRGLAPSQALEAVCATAAYRDPAEGVKAGRATMDDLYALLEQSAS